MAAIFGALNISDSDRVLAQTVGWDVLYGEVQKHLDMVRGDLAAASAVFVSGRTEKYSQRYYLPGGGYLQRRRSQGGYGASKVSGYWDVAFPLEDFGDAIAGNDVDTAYMTVASLEKHISGIIEKDVNTYRFEMLKALLNNTARTFQDEQHGSLTIQPLANGDTVTYPPVLGATDQATDDHYLESGYASASVSDTNNPYETVADELEEHFGTPSGGSNIIAFINNAQRKVTEALTDFDEVADRFTNPGTMADQLFGLPSVPGRIIGRVSHVWVSEWRYVPANYIVTVHLDADAPLMERTDPADTNLPTGLNLVKADGDAVFPFVNKNWRHRFGLGVANRLAACVMELGTGGTYSIPSGYS